MRNEPIVPAIKRRGRKKLAFYRKYRKRIKELVDRFMEGESAEAYIGRAVLAMIGLGGVLMVGAIAPNIFSAFGKYNKNSHYDQKQLHKSVYYLRKRGLVKFVKKSDKVCEIKITRQGRSKLAEFAIEQISLRIDKPWDGKWRAVVFDIPERDRHARNSLRRKLKELGLIRLQQSIFMHPYPIEDEILFIAAFFDVEKYIEILTVENMLDDSDLRKHFGL